jgi:hypothetical protein
MVMEFAELTQFLEPPECQNKYITYHRPTLARDYLFWLNRPGSSHFRVLWDDVEVGRCEIATGYCEVYLP